MEEITVAVIGGAGFLGQHIVRELQIWSNKQNEERRKRETCDSHENERLCQVVNLNCSESDSSSLIDLHPDDIQVQQDTDYENCNFIIKEIRILDIKPFEPFFEFFEYPVISATECDIRSESQISEELHGVKVAFHCAALILRSTSRCNGVRRPKQDEFQYWETNLEGTENVIWGCKKADVKVLIYTSTIGAVMGGQHILSHSESLTPAVDEKDLILGAYGRSRKRAEDIILNAHKTQTSNERELLTTVIRPVALYGEGDTRFIPSFIDMAKRAGGKMAPLGSRFGYHQLMYAGNAAFAHVCAMIHLLNGTPHPLRDCGGLSAYVTDDSPAGTTDEILNPFLNNFGLSATHTNLPLVIVLIITFLTGMWVSLCQKIGRPSRWESVMPSLELQSLAGTTTIVGRTRAELTLHYQPKYTWDQARMASIDYYERLVERNGVMSLEN